MTGEAAVRLNKYSEVRESIYGKHVRSSDMLLTGLIYGCTAVSLLILVIRGRIINVSVREPVRME